MQCWFIGVKFDTVNSHNQSQKTALENAYPLKLLLSNYKGKL